jgi:hypothetical protein
MVRYQHLRNDKGFLSTHEDRAYWPGITVLWTLGIYQLGLQFALSSTWLYFADLGVINELAQKQSAFNIAYTAAQFCYSTYLTIWVYRLPYNAAYKPGDGQNPLEQENLYVNVKLSFPLFFSANKTIRKRRRLLSRQLHSKHDL